MKLYLFRQSNDVPLDELADVCEGLGATLDVTPTVVKHPVRKIELSRLLEASESFLDRGEPIVAVVLTTGTCEEGILGQGVRRSRAGWVRFSPDKKKTVLVALHELGHICEAGHCEKRDCLMYPFYVPRRADGEALQDLLCQPCYTIITESWVYRRLRSTETAENSRGGHRRVRAIPLGAAGVYVGAERNTGESFPDWSLPREAFVEQVKKFFGCD